MTPKYLTKSKFKTAYSCPRKLYYSENKEYGNKNTIDEFLAALAEGGFQVGALAKCYYPDGIDLEDLNTKDAIAKTAELLKSEKVTIFEAALNVGPYLVRVDILEKLGNSINLYEVKAKSFKNGIDQFFSKTGSKRITAKWEEYVVDVAFQTWVAQNYFPSSTISPYLTLANSLAVSTTDGLHQYFRIYKDGDRTKVETKAGLNSERLGARILVNVPVSDEVDFILKQHSFPSDGSSAMKLSEYADYLANSLTTNTKLPANITKDCKHCEFKIGTEQKVVGKESGFEDCWITEKKLTPATVTTPLIFDLWYAPSETLLEEGIVHLKDVSETHLTGKRGPRQWLQVRKHKENDSSPDVCKGSLESLESSIRYPLNFIDFETSMVGVPFHRNRRPYEQLAFQFSHHVMQSNGSIAHQAQYIHVEPGEFPNFEFLRHLKRTLCTNEGTIFRFADHENTVLRQIRNQLGASDENDKLELMQFIDHITKETGAKGKAGSRNMIDLRQKVVEAYYHPLMGGSNSIKKVIPAILHGSDYLREKYSKQIYGTTEIPSLNFQNVAWIDEGKVTDPYKKLQPLFESSKNFDTQADDDEVVSKLFNNEGIKDGGAAMTAWARMQFIEMSQVERRELKNGLLRYCELDTLSMVWIMEHFLRIK